MPHALSQLTSDAPPHPTRRRERLRRPGLLAEPTSKGTHRAIGYRRVADDLALRLSTRPWG